ncbi:hypothetical protein M422DRAFT_254842 [Sphaerobolus stellatus SS14]|uniref:Uncharacterized protein n=1 Tax=Sphaerobolus stellatus (strain SS14) TaxID=990650 RepID=A0A0C9UGG4_SPHS4|nr:hypothetical protein M422DRAFT_254842 [Sphaerobolus stellatus SS14]
MMSCVDLLEDKDGIRIAEANWSMRLPLIYGPRGNKDLDLKALLSYSPGEQTLLNDITASFFSESFGVPHILSVEHAICPITRTTLKLGRFAVAAQIIAGSSLGIAYKASDFDVVIIAHRRC